MSDLTMGQRIAAQRKLAGWSQEALAEKMEVSRQAVSKWESDASIPEIDKLIALGRFFGVSVDWLLGTGTQPHAAPGLNESQTRMVEALIRDTLPRKSPLWKRGLALVCAMALFAGAAIPIKSRMDQLSREQAAAQTQLSQLRTENQQMRSQLEAMTALLEKQDAASRLLRDYGVRGYASEDLSEVTLTFALTPKVYREGMEASLHITGPEGGTQTYGCRWDGAEYLVRVTLPAADGYRYVFRLTGEENWEEDILNELDPAIGNLKTHTAFSVDPSDPAVRELNGPWPSGERVYTFDVLLYPPFAQPRSSAAFQSLVFTLYHNGSPIWSRDWKADYEKAMGGFKTYNLPVSPDIQAELPELAAGDTLRLELKAILTAGQEVITLLDERTVE